MDVSQWNAAQYVTPILQSPVFWAAIIAAAAALTAAVVGFKGVTKSIANARVQVERQIEAAAAQKELDRKHDRERAIADREHALAKADAERRFQLKQSVFLEAAAWSSDIVVIAGQLPDISIERLGGESGAAHASAPARVNLVATHETIAACTALSTAYAKLLAEFSPRRVELRHSGAELARLTADITQRIADNRPPAETEVFMAERDAIHATHFPAMRAFLADYILRLPEMNILAARCQILMSRELGFQVDEAERLELVERQNELGLASVQGMLVWLDQLTAAEESPEAKDA